MKFATKTPKRMMGRKVARYVLWTAVAIILLRGIGSFFNPHAETNAQGLEEIPILLNGSGQGFAQSFANDYFTFDPDNPAEHADRMNRYLTSDVAAKSLLNFQGTKATYQTLDTHVFGVNDVDEHHIDVLLKVDILMTLIERERDEKSGEAVERTTEEEITKFVTVPVSYQDGNLFVNDLPTFEVEATERNGEGKALPKHLRSVPNNLHEEIEKNVSDFLQAYSEGTSSQLRFFMDNVQEVDGYGGNMTFEGLNSVNVYDTTNLTEESNEPIASVVVYVESKWHDNQIDLPVTQRHRLEYRFGTDRWLITEFLGGWKVWN